MNLTGYSDSESDSEAPPVPKTAAKPTSKPAFHKAVDRSSAGRIKINLPGASQSRAEKDDIQDDAPPAKKPRLGGASAFGGFNAMLPAPKKPVVNATVATTEGTKMANRGLGKKLASGVNLKTGAEPAFKRESRVEAEDYDETGNPIKKEPMRSQDFRALLNLPPPKTEVKVETQPEMAAEDSKVVPEPQQVPKPAAARFVPMSVGKGKKKKPAGPRPGTVSTSESKSSNTQGSAPQTALAEAKPRKPKVSLFGVSNDAGPVAKEPSSGQYQPLLYGVEDNEDAPMPDESNHPAQNTPPPAAAPAPDGLTNIASELNLSEAERRQLFGKRGRGGPDFSSAKIVDFNTDTEYAHNEKLRQQGEQVQHNALKSISGTGKNSLRSLINVATTQKDALEDHFASGHRNKREAGNKYGW
ncbi:hypothetical protein EJ02DRAFT_158061 [Clathrospora elynae]|uniref:Mitotic checkpoint regulator, MAD2B-interacting-domain-containing protein n=1 Tax=Clathrospora elynae TaxID=706981 RepID=A0A6A5SSZ6_9PLEO|nr:hypothetical protein EJ02DRAFT_158061 [Clathrospora elynae]